MNKRGFTLIELIAVVVIMAIIALIATPNIVDMMNKGKKEDYVSDAKEIISKATYMYKQEKYKEKFSTGVIKLEDIESISNDFKDPYGLEYDKKKSYVIFIEPDNSGTLAEREVAITLISHNDKECHTIDNTFKSDLSFEQVKQGTWNGTGCVVVS